MKLNTNNKQLAFQYKPKTNEYVLETISDTMVLSTDNIRLKYYEGEDLFCVDVGYSIDGDVSKMSFKIDDLIVYPVVLKTPDKLQQQVINNQAIYIISEDYNFKSIIFIPIAQLNKTFEYTITSYNSCISSFVVDEIGRKFNSDVIHAEATQVTQTNEALGDNVQTALDTLNTKDNTIDTLIQQLKEKDINLQNQIDILLKRYMIPPQFIQVSEADGTFDDNKAPANWYKNMYGVTTVWGLVYADESMFLRTEGSLANAGRSNGIQGDAIRNIVGRSNDVSPLDTTASQTPFSGALYFDQYITNTFYKTKSVPNQPWGYVELCIDASRVVPTATENRVKNRLIRIYVLESIEGMTIKEFIQYIKEVMNAIHNLQQKN